MFFIAKISRKGVLLLLCVGVIVSITHFASAASVNENLNEHKTIGYIEDELAKYLTVTRPEIIVGSTEYVEYLTNLLMFEDDKQLSKSKYYEEIKVYASEYLTKVNEISSINIQEKGGLAVISLTKEEKNKQLGDIIDEAEKDDISMMKTTSVASKISVAAKSSGYSDAKAIKYAHDWANSYNNKYGVFKNDCTNYVSQCIKEGGKSFAEPNSIPRGINGTTKYWYSQRYKSGSPSVPHYTYRVSSSFINVNDFFTYWKNKGVKTKSYETKAKLQNGVHKGDVVQLKGEDGKWYHTIIITAGKKGAWKYCGHTKSRNDYPVSKISNKNKFRVLEF